MGPMHRCGGKRHRHRLHHHHHITVTITRAHRTQAILPSITFMKHTIQEIQNSNNIYIRCSLRNTFCLKFLDQILHCMFYSSVVALVMPRLPHFTSGFISYRGIINPRLCEGMDPSMHFVVNIPSKCRSFAFFIRKLSWWIRCCCTHELNWSYFRYSPN